jgi:oligopeptidase B
MDPLTPPVAVKQPHAVTLHGDTRNDDYSWLAEKENPDVRAYLEAENAYAASVLAPLAPLKESLYKEMLGRIKQTDISVPCRVRGFWYYSRTEEGKQYPILCRRAGSMESAEEVTLDVNVLAEGERFMSVGLYEPCESGRLLAFATDNTGYRVYTLFVKDLSTGNMVRIAERVGSVAWAANDTALFYTVEDDAKRQYRLYRHELGSAAHDLIREETDERFRIGVYRCMSRQYLILDSESHTQTEVRFLAAERPFDEWRIVAERREDHEYDVSHHSNRFYIRTNSGGRNFRLVTAPVESPGENNWHEIVAHREEVMLESVSAFQNHLVVFEREDGLPHMRVTRLDSNETHRVAMPEPVYEVSPHRNAEFDTDTYRYQYESLVTPASVFEYGLNSRSAVLLKQVEVLGGYDASQYVSERLWAAAPDGTRVPVSLVRRGDAVPTRESPLLLYGYGSYGYTVPVGFSSNRLSLLDRGVTWALAHIRGGGDLGKKWHDQGRMLQKRNTFTDFIACAEHLIANGYTSPGKLAMEGGSAGGLLVGAVLNLRPDLFHAAIAHVPFVDVLNTMMDETLPLTVGEFEEWGNPKLAEEYAYIKSYCPYSNLADREYPAILVKTSFDDSQVMYHEPAKFTARLRAVKNDANPLLFLTNMAGGHGGSSGRYDKLGETAQEYAFLLWQFGVADVAQ